MKTNGRPDGWMDGWMDRWKGFDKFNWTQAKEKKKKQRMKGKREALSDTNIFIGSLTNNYVHICVFVRE